MKNPFRMWAESRWNTPLSSVCLIVALAAGLLFIRGLRLHRDRWQLVSGQDEYSELQWVREPSPYLETHRAKLTGGVALGALLLGAVGAWFATREE